MSSISACNSRHVKLSVFVVGNVESTSRINILKIFREVSIEDLLKFESSEITGKQRKLFLLKFHSFSRSPQRRSRKTNSVADKKPKHN